MKKIFYYTDVLPFLGKSDMAIKKLERNLATFKEASENVYLVWHPWSKTEEYLKLNKSGVINEYQRIVHEYCEAGWGDFDKSGTLQEAKAILFNCDAYYGDPSDLAYEAQLAKMPVMLQNIDI
jgi:hypothetical protein